MQYKITDLEDKLNNKNLCEFIKLYSILSGNNTFDAYNLYKFDYLSDVNYTINGYEYKLHSFIICENSGYFSKLKTEQKNIEIKIGEELVKKEYIDEIIKYLYTSNSTTILKEDMNIFKYYLISKLLDLKIQKDILKKIKNILKKIEQVDKVNEFIKNVNSIKPSIDSWKEKVISLKFQEKYYGFVTQELYNKMGIDNELKECINICPELKKITNIGEYTGINAGSKIGWFYYDCKEVKINNPLKDIHISKQYYDLINTEFCNESLDLKEKEYLSHYLKKIVV